MLTNPLFDPVAQPPSAAASTAGAASKFEPNAPLSPQLLMPPPRNLPRIPPSTSERRRRSASRSGGADLDSGATAADYARCSSSGKFRTRRFASLRKRLRCACMRRGAPDSQDHNHAGKAGTAKRHAAERAAPRPFVTLRSLDLTRGGAHGSVGGAGGGGAAAEPPAAMSEQAFEAAMTRALEDAKGIYAAAARQVIQVCQLECPCAQYIVLLSGSSSAQYVACSP
jgi:hypothetical protein